MTNQEVEETTETAAAPQRSPREVAMLVGKIVGVVLGVGLALTPAIVLRLATGEWSMLIVGPCLGVIALAGIVWALRPIHGGHKRRQ